MKIKIIGAGLFGCAIGYELNRVGHDVTIIEQDPDIMLRASKCNHNRLHLGYHYPRSVETAQQSLDGLVTFLTNYKDAIVSKFPNYYMIAKDNSNVSPEQYIQFCEKVNIDYTEEYPDSNIVNHNMIDLSIRTDEPVFDYDMLTSYVREYIKGIDIKFNTTFDGNIDDCDYLINASYANINKVHKLLGIPDIKLKFQDVIVPYFEMKSSPFGVTIMDGPFCSVLPKGYNDNTFLLYNVEHSVRYDSDPRMTPDDRVNKIYQESEKYLPFLSSVKKLDYWRTTRALPINDNDERLSEIFTFEEHPKVISVLSGKVSTCHTIGQEIKRMICK